MGVMNLALSDANSKRVSEILHKIAVLQKNLRDKSRVLEADSTIINTEIQTLHTELENIKEQ